MLSPRTFAERNILPTARSSHWRRSVPSEEHVRQFSERQGFRSDIEGLRGIAIILVVAYHAGLSRVSGGYIGVDVFFVLSGYLITSLLVEEVQRSGGIQLGQFYARRARRLLPASALVLFVTALAAWFVYIPLEHPALLSAGRAALLYFSNIRFARLATDYYAPDASQNPFLHMWSLSVEEQFYMLWPGLIWLSSVFSKRQSASQAESRSHVGDSSRFRRPVSIALLAVFLASLLTSIIQTHRGSSWAFFGLPARAWEFALGGLVIGAFRERASIRTARVTGLAGLVAVLSAAALFDSHTSFPGIAAILPTLGTALLLISGEVDGSSPLQRMLRTRPLRVLGRLSYSWYLWHWPFLVIGAALIGNTRFAPALALAALLAAQLTYTFVESPVRYCRALRESAIRTFAMGASITLVVLASIQVTRGLSARASLRSPLREYAAASEDYPKLAGCELAYGVVIPASPCMFGDPAAKRTIVLFGDSHAAQWFPALSRMAHDDGWRIRVIAKSGCSLAATEQPLTGARSDCRSWLSAAVNSIRQTKPDLIVASTSNGYVVRGPDGLPVDRDSLTHLSLAQWQRGLRATMHDLDRLGEPVLFLKDTPRPNIDVPVCLARAFWRSTDPSICQFPRARGIRAEVEISDSVASVGTRNISIVDMNHDICPEDSCNVTRDSVVIYRDSNHLTTSFAATLAPKLAVVIRRMAQSGASTK